MDAAGKHPVLRDVEAHRLNNILFELPAPQIFLLISDFCQLLLRDIDTAAEGPGGISLAIRYQRIDDIDPDIILARIQPITDDVAYRAFPRCQAAENTAVTRLISRMHDAAGNHALRRILKAPALSMEIKPCTVRRHIIDAAEDARLSGRNRKAFLDFLIGIEVFRRSDSLYDPAGIIVNSRIAHAFPGVSVLQAHADIRTGSIASLIQQPMHFQKSRNIIGMDNFPLYQRTRKILQYPRQRKMSGNPRKKHCDMLPRIILPELQPRMLNGCSERALAFPQFPLRTHKLIDIVKGRITDDRTIALFFTGHGPDGQPAIALIRPAQPEGILRDEIILRCPQDFGFQTGTILRVHISH